MPTDPPAAIELHGVVKRFPPDVTAVDGLSLRVDTGEITALVGPSGCGKTTTLRLIAGFERADAGRILVGGRVVDDGRTAEAPEARRVGFVFQDYALFPHLTVHENLGFGLRHLDRAARRARVVEVLGLLALDGLGGRYPHELSGGQQQRVAVGRALAPGSRIVLLDEPLSNLDASLRRSVRWELRRTLAGAGVTAVIVTHDQEEALEIADRVAVLHRGRLEQLGAPRAVYTTPATPFVARFIGETSVLAGSVLGAGIETEIGTVPNDRGFAPGEEVEVMLRPSQLCLEPNAAGAAVVVACVFAGSHAAAIVRLESGAELRCARDEAFAPAEGTRVHVRIRGGPVMAVLRGSKESRGARRD